MDGTDPTHVEKDTLPHDDSLDAGTTGIRAHAVDTPIEGAGPVNAGAGARTDDEGEENLEDPAKDRHLR